ncbi:MAG TPA: glycogen debranching N-terminal domain-containing protein [Gaiellaceae bacterium]|nr:glycogen debranching N-terminal domain-containing protein [Gaiellaceae bacterium]
MTLTILEGSTFVVCDEIGDVVNGAAGLYADDTRFLSRLLLRIGGQRPLLLSSGRVEYFSAAFYLRNPLAAGLAADTVSIARERFVGEGMTDRLRLRNEGMDEVSFELELAFATDFADIISVKQHDFALGSPLEASPLPENAPARYDDDGNQLLLEADDGRTRTQIVFSRPAQFEDGCARFAIRLSRGEAWELRYDVVAATNGELSAPQAVERRFGTELAHVRESLAAWHLRVPQLKASWDELDHTYRRSISDLAALRLRREGTLGALPAAGMPWFMTVFGRDTIITSLQTLLFGPELAWNALEALAVIQATADDPSIDAEPGKIVHELRRGRAAETWFPAYYGSVDATPLYLVLLSEVWRWTDDATLANGLREPALRALEWIDRWGDRDGDGFVEYERRTPRGLENQSWKDSGDSQRFHDGRFAAAPIAPAEVQGYVYDAKVRLAEIARAVWRDRELADRLEADAAELRARFDRAYWVEERGGYYALALDREKRPVDALCSNMGHLLWSGIVPDERAPAVVDALMGNGLWSGWGIRTMSTDDAAYNPISYHTGTVWPHDTSLAAWGLARYGRWEEARRIVRTIFDAARHFDWSLPEVFAGFDRTETPFPIAYPTAARPQAWAAGAPVLCLQLLLGLRPERRETRLVSDAPPDVPRWAGTLRLQGVRAFDRIWDVRLEGGAVAVTDMEVEA